MLALLDFAARLPSLLREVGIAGLCDIAIVTLVIHTFIVAVKRTQRSGLIFTGILITGAVYLAARKLDLKLTATLLQGFFAVILVALVVIFQEDLRHFFERVALWWIERRLPLANRTPRQLPAREIEILARSLADLARARIGALVVVRGREALDRHLAGGEDVDGLVSEPLLKSIFDPHSLGHDGAVIIEGHRIQKLGCHLPLSKRLDRLPHSGTRHAAGLGLAELTDALCLIVSEERGAISVARQGEMTTVADAAHLVRVIEQFHREITPAATRAPWTGFFRSNYREKATAFLLATTLWMAVVYRSQVVQRGFEVPVGYTLLPSGLEVASCEPATIMVTFSGQRKDFGFLKPSEIKLTFDLLDAKPGRRSFPVQARDLVFPSGLELEDIEPRQVNFTIHERPGANGVLAPAP